MLWEPAWAALLTTKLSAVSGLPAITSPVHGVDASLATSMFTDTGAVTQAAAGQSVARANDAFGGSANSFQQGTATDRPQLLANLAAGKPGLRFNGTSHWMRLAPNAGSGALFQGRSFTICAVYRNVRGDGTVSGVFAFGNADGGTNNGGYDALLLETGSLGEPVIYRHTGSEYSAAAPSGVSASSNVLAKVVVRGSQANGMEVRIRSSAGAFSGTGAMPSSADLFPWDAALLGAELRWQSFFMPAFRFAGDIMEVRFWASRATDAQLTQLQAYLDAKWGA